MAILIRGKEVSKSYKHYFELLWKIAKPWDLQIDRLLLF
jgi:hypothetical protein